MIHWRCNSENLMRGPWTTLPKRRALWPKKLQNIVRLDFDTFHGVSNENSWRSNGNQIVLRVHASKASKRGNQGQWSGIQPLIPLCETKELLFGFQWLRHTTIFSRKDQLNVILQSTEMRKSLCKTYLSRTQARLGRAFREQLLQSSPNHVQGFFLSSVEEYSYGEIDFCLIALLLLQLCSSGNP